MQTIQIRTDLPSLQGVLPRNFVAILIGKSERISVFAKAPNFESEVTDTTAYRVKLITLCKCLLRIEQLPEPCKRFIRQRLKKLSPADEIVVGLEEAEETIESGTFIERCTC